MSKNVVRILWSLTNPLMWHTIEFEYENTASANTQHVALLDDSAIDFINNNSNNVKVQVKDFVFVIDNVKYRQ